MRDHDRVWYEVRPGGPGDLDASHAAAQLSAYFELESARSSRRVLFRIVTTIALAAAVLQATTQALPGPVLFVVLLALGTLALVAAIIEWRAEKQLSDGNTPHSSVPRSTTNPTEK